MLISIIGDILLALLIFSMPKLISDASIKIITTIILCILLLINNNILIKKIRVNYAVEEENDACIKKRKKINIGLLIVASIVGVLSGVYLFSLYN